MTTPAGVQTDPQVVSSTNPPPGAATGPTQSLPGTDIVLPAGKGIETIQSITPPFRTNAPAWYTPGIWGKLGCAVPQPGRYLQSNNTVIWDIVNVIGGGLFNLAWRYPDRKFTRAPSSNLLWELHQLLTIGRKRLVDLTALPNEQPLVPTHSTPAPQMFVVYPIPLFGPMGCPNTWLNKVFNMTLMMMSEAMQHADNELAFYVTKPFFDTVYGYLKYLLVDMSMKFFGIDKAAASVDTYTIPPAAWAAYNPAALEVSSEATTSRPPMGYDPTDLDLEPIRGIPVVQAIPLLQPWPDSQLKYASGGTWGGQPLALGSGVSPTTGTAAPATAGNPTTTTPSSPLFATNGPPTA